MKVKREAVVAAVVALVLTVVLIGAVGAKVESSVAAEEGLITNLRMSDSCEGDDIVLFPAGTETVYLAFDYSDMHGEEMRIKVDGPKFSVEAEHSSVIKSSGWITETWSEAYGEQYVKACGTVSPNATLTSTFKAAAISMSYVKDADGGVAEVRVDGGTPITVDMCAATTTKGERVIASGLSSELHTITVKVISQTNSCDGNCVGIDRFWNEVILYDATHSFTGSDTKCITLTHSYGAIPAGSYTANIYSGGSLPIKSKLWHVRPGGPGEIKDFRMSISPDPDAPSVTEFPPGTQTVYAVFDYENIPEEDEIRICVREVTELETGCIVERSENYSGSGSGYFLVRLPRLGESFSAGLYRSLISKGEYVDQVTDWRVNNGVYLPLVLKNQP